MKNTVLTLFGMAGGALAALLLCMGVDYVTGLIVAGVFRRSEKTENGGSESRVGRISLCRAMKTN